MTRRHSWLVGWLVCACSPDVPIDEGTSEGGEASSTAVDTTTTGSSTTSMPADSSEGGETVHGTSSESTSGDPPLLDMGARPDVGVPVELCPPPELDVLPACDAMAPADSFDPVLKWSWDGEGSSMAYSMATPLVANLNDDNSDGNVDLCDVPDIVVLGVSDLGFGRLVALDGATGSLHFETPADVSGGVVPAVGDIDGDNTPEIVAFQGYGVGNLGRFIALESDGEVLWYGEDVDTMASNSAISLADLDADGDVEIMARRTVIDHEGQIVWGLPDTAMEAVMGTAADLDDDGLLEVVVGPTAYRHDGTPYYERDDDFPLDAPAHVVDINGDTRPETVLAMDGQVVIIDDDGDDTIYPIPAVRRSEGVVHDIDGDGQPDFAAGGDDAAVLVSAIDDTATWVFPMVHRVSTSAFDFLGDGSAEVLTMDYASLQMIDGDGGPVMAWPRSGVGYNVTPVVADVDNDGSAEIVLVSGEASGDNPQLPIVQVIADAENRWVPARRIWNQHTYHVTNVYEDGTIPQVEPQQWLSHHTFRAQAQIVADGRICIP